MRLATCRFSLCSCLAAAGVTSTLQAKCRHHLVEGDGRFPGTAVRFQCRSAQVCILQVIEAVFDQFAEVESLAAIGDASEVLEPGLNLWFKADRGRHAAS